MAEVLSISNIAITLHSAVFIMFNLHNPLQLIPPTYPDSRSSVLLREVLSVINIIGEAMGTVHAHDHINSAPHLHHLHHISLPRVN